MKKKGFTLVELLAVIAILAILVIIALPNIMSMFNEAKKSTFTTELKNIYRGAEQAYVKDAFKNSGTKVYSKCKSGCTNELDMNVRDDLEYYIEINSSGKIVKLYARDNSYQFNYEGEMTINDIKDAVSIADLQGPQLLIINDGVETIYPEPESSDYYLMAGTSSSSGNFLRTNIQKNKIEKITFVTSIGGHTANGTDCFDLSKGSNGSVLAWVTDDDSNGLYELTIGTNGQVFISSGQYLFYGLTNLTTIEGMENLNISKTNTLYMMFYDCAKLTSIDLSHFDTRHITSMGYLFKGCSSLTSLDLSHFDTSNVTNMKYMFWDCTKLENLNISSFNTSKVTNFMGMFNKCKKLTSLDLSHFNTNSATDMSQMFSDCSNLTSLNISNFNTSKVTDMSSMFYNCSNLTSLDVSHFDTSKVTKMGDMFRSCSKLTSINVSGFDTSKVIDMQRMFYSCSSLTSLDVSHFNTSRVTSMNSMFDGCSGLTSLDLSSFDTSKVTDMSFMFSKCSKLTSLNLDSFTNPLVTNINDMFSDCTKLSSISFGNFNTSNVIYMNNVFGNCKALTSLNLSSFNTSKAQYTKSMFYNCTNLKTIYANDMFNISSISSSNSASMFYGDTKLVGGSGTKYNSSKTGKSYAHIDEGTSNPGYFTRDEL